jgi:hypothetical protein
MPGFKARNVLITGSSPYALRLARAFHETGHHVNIAAAQTSLLPSHAAVSFAQRKYMRIKTRQPSKDPHSWIQELVVIISRENIELWVDCNTDTPASVLTQAKAVIERKTNCLCFGSTDEYIPIFARSSTFLKFAAENGLPVPESYEVKSRDDIHKILHQSKGKRKYILSDTNGAGIARPALSLPRRTLSQTYDEVARVKILQNSKLRLDQAVEDGSHYRSTSVIVNGKLKAFSACAFAPEGSSPSSYTALAPTSTLSLAMLQFLTSLMTKVDTYTGHLTIDFTVDERPSPSNPSAIEKRILPTAAHTSASTPLLLFTNLEGSINLVRAYVSLFGRSANGFIRGDDEVSLPTLIASPTPSSSPSTSPTATPALDHGIYALGPALSSLLLTPLLRLITLRSQPDGGSGLFYVLGAAIAFVRQLLWWQEAVYDFKDPLPFWYLYQVYVPVRLLGAAVFGGTGRVEEVARELRGLVL